MISTDYTQEPKPRKIQEYIPPWITSELQSQYLPLPETLVFEQQPLIGISEINLFQTIYSKLIEDYSSLLRSYTEILDRIKELEKKQSEPIKTKTLVLEEISEAEATERIVDFFKGFEERIYPDELAHKLGIDFQVVMKILDKLKEEGKIEIID